MHGANILTGLTSYGDLPTTEDIVNRCVTEQRALLWRCTGVASRQITEYLSVGELSGDTTNDGKNVEPNDDPYGSTTGPSGGGDVGFSVHIRLEL